MRALLGACAAVIAAGCMDDSGRGEGLGTRPPGETAGGRRTLESPEGPPFESDYRLVSATPDFAGAPVRITVFSDFQCPPCGHFSETLSGLSELPRHDGKINVQHVFFPLDPACNPAVKRPIHPHACKAAYLAACLPERFPEVEGEIFAMQRGLSDEWLEGVAEREGVLDCYRSDEAKAVVDRHVAAGNSFGVRSTPTWVLNGRRFEGSMPLPALEELVDEELDGGP